MLDTGPLEKALAKNKRKRDINLLIDKIRHMIAVEGEKEKPDIQYLLDETMEMYID